MRYYRPPSKPAMAIVNPMPSLCPSLDNNNNNNNNNNNDNDNNNNK